MAVHGFRQSDNNFNKENNCYSNRCILNETSNKKIRLAKFRTLYCTNTVMTLQLILSRDIAGQKQKPPTCSTCNKTMCSNSKKFYFTFCGSISHLKRITPSDKILSRSMQRLDLLVLYSKYFNIL